MVTKIILALLLTAVVIILPAIFVMSAKNRKIAKYGNIPKSAINNGGKKVIYLIGSLKNRKVIDVAKKLRGLGFEVFDDWISPGPEADDFWREYEKRRGSSYKDALSHWAAKHIFEFDKTHIDRSDIGILIMPAGKSGHLELGYMIGKGKKGYVLFEEEPERWDIMYQFADNVFFDLKDLMKELEKLR